MAQIVLENVYKVFGETVAVQDFSVTVADGEFVTFLGPSGCGKTTCLRMIAGFISPNQGRIIIGDQVVSDASSGIHIPPERRGVGMVFQSYAVWPHMTVFANVAYPLKIKKRPQEEIQRRVRAVLGLVKMAELADRYPHQLSGGQQQRVALARALVMDPGVLLLDEPLSNLDAKLREEMRLELKELQHETGVTIIFVTHDQLEAMVLSDRVVVMKEGTIQQIDTPREIYQNPTNRFVAEFIGVANFIPCRWQNGVLRLEGTPGIVLPFSPPASMRSQPVNLMVRPEHIRLTREDTPPVGQVARLMFLGDTVEYIVSMGHHALRVKGDPDSEFAVGEKVHITFERIHFFPA